MNATVLVNVDVDDLARAIAFYSAAFGLTVGRQFGGGAAELLGGGTPIYLLQNDAGSGPADRTRTYDRHWTPVHLDFVVADIDVALTRALAAGAVQEGAVRTEDWGRIVGLADPFGHGICLLQFLNRGYDEIADC